MNNVPSIENHIPSRSIVVTGGSGFIGTNFIRWVFENQPDVGVINIDALTYAGNPANLREFEGDARYRFVKGDLRDSSTVEGLFVSDRFPDFPVPETVVHFAAESHVDRSITGPVRFSETNVIGTQNLLESLRKGDYRRLVLVSTDEVYGDLDFDAPPFTEDHPLKPSSPYSASKAAADLLVLAYVRTYGVDALVTRCSNNYGPYQFPEKLIPLMTINASQGKSLPVYGEGTNVRDWIYVEDHCTGIWAALEKGKAGRVYNFGGNAEVSNLDLVRKIIAFTGADPSLIQFVKDRPGHDLRYAMDFSRASKELGWQPEKTFEQALEQTVNWYLENAEWWQPILDGEYRLWVEHWYGEGTGDDR